MRPPTGAAGSSTATAWAPETETIRATRLALAGQTRYRLACAGFATVVALAAAAAADSASVHGGGFGHI